MANLKKDSLISHEVDLTFSAEKKGISEWLRAYVVARIKRVGGRVQIPRYKLMIDVYEAMMLDGHLSSAWANRKARVLGEEFGIFNADGSKDEEASGLLEAAWFTDSDRGFISMALDAKMYKSSLLELMPKDINGPLAMPVLVERRNVIPDLRIVLQRPYDNDGYNIDDPVFRDNYILVEGAGYGLLLKCAPLTMYKRYAMQAWVEHAEVFSMDLLIGTTDTQDATAVNELQDRLLSGGRRRIVVKNAMEKVESISQSSSDAFEIYKQLCDYCDKENSKLIQGATGLSDMGTNYKEAGVHQQTALEIAEGDVQFVEAYVNDELLPRLPKLSSYYSKLAGKGKYFKFVLNRKAPLNDRRDLFKMLMEQGFEVTPETIKEEFGVEVGERVKPQPAAAPIGNEAVKVKGSF